MVAAGMLAVYWLPVALILSSWVQAPPPCGRAATAMLSVTLAASVRWGTR
jgi:hypothetical protein